MICLLSKASCLCFAVSGVRPLTCACTQQLGQIMCSSMYSVPAWSWEQVDNDTMEMLRSMNMANLPGLQLAAVSDAVSAAHTRSPCIRL